MAVLFYAYPGCSTCRSARRWLDEHAVVYREVDISCEPPSAAQLRSIRQAAGVPLRRLFNTSGQVYRAGAYATRLPTMTDEAALAELAADGMLIRRPLLVGDTTAVVGFRPEDYAAATAV